MVSIRENNPDKICRICGKKCGCYTHYREKFRLKKEPRYIKYTTNYSKWKEDLNLYNDHRKRVYYAKCVVDSNPPPMNLLFYLRGSRLRGDAKRQFIIDKENKKMIKNILEINRIGGVVDSFNPNAYSNVSCREKYQRDMREIEKLNEAMLLRICDARPNYPKKEHDANWKLQKKSMKLLAQFPFIINKKKDPDASLQAQPSISEDMYRFGAIKPECYMEFQVEDGEYLGKIVVQLYQDFAPVTVQNFMAFIKGFGNLSYKNCPVHRIVKNRFLETGDVTKGNGTGGYSIYGESFDEEKHKLKHTKAGVLTMSRLGGKQQNNSKFCITFMNMQEWDKKNVVFGKVVYGAKVLTKLSDYGRTIGKPLRKIIISNCGLVPDCTCEENY